MKKSLTKTVIFVCAALVITIILGTASVLAANAIIESKSIGVDKALAIALEAKELEGADVEETSVKLRVRDGVAVYVVRLDCEAVKYTVIVNAGTGEVIEVTEKECVKPEKPEKPAETEPTETPEDGETAPEESTRPEFGKHNGKEHGKGHGKGHGKMPKRQGSSGKDKAPAAPEETTAPEATA